MLTVLIISCIIRNIRLELNGNVLILITNKDRGNIMGKTEYDFYNDIEYFEHMLFLLDDVEMIQDLHIHTCNSDGIYPLKYTCEKIQDSPIQLFCITDHNYMFDKREKCMMATKKLFIYGTELSCCYEDNRVHILGYFLNTDNVNTKEIINKIHQGHCEREKLRISNMQRKSNTKLTYERFIFEHHDQVPNWRRVAASLVSSGDAKNINDASERFLKKGKSGYLSYSDNWPKVDAREAVLAIVRDGGIPVIAHLGDLEYSIGIEKTVELLTALKQCGVVGYDTSNGGKHCKISKNLVEICEEKLQLYSFYGTDCHNADFTEKYHKTSIAWLSDFLVRYAQKYLNQYFKYKLINLIQASITPDFDFKKIPSGYIKMLEKEEIVTFEHLIKNLKNRGDFNANILLCIIAIINCLSYLVTEKKLRKMVLKALEVDSTTKYLEDYFKRKIRKFESAILKNHLNSNDKKRLIRTWIPIFYRVNLYDEAIILLNQLLDESDFKSFIDFKNKFNKYKSDNYIEFENSKVFFDNIMNFFCEMKFTKTIINRNIKSYASCYQKFVNCYLLGKNPKIPTKCERIYYKNFFEMFEDLYAATVITNHKINVNNVLDVLEKNNIRYNIILLSDISRRWYHQRIIALLKSNHIIIEILVKTIKEYWFAYYYYWKTKNYFIFDIESNNLKDKINNNFIGKDEMMHIAIEDLLTCIRGDT